MTPRSIDSVIAGILVVLAMSAAPITVADDFPEFNRDPSQARIVTDDLDRFWTAWDKAERRPEARREIFQREYLDAGSPGLQAFIELRIQDADRLLATIDRHREYYVALRAQAPSAAAAAEPVRAAMERLQELLPDAVFPDVYLVFGIMNSGGTVHGEGLLIGLEMYGLTPETDMEQFSRWHRAVLKPMDELPAIIAHELVHFQQLNLSRTSFDTLLGQSIFEGAADFVAELLLGHHINPAVHRWALQREAALWSEFREVMHDQDFSGWLYDGEHAPDGRPADLGYFIGYRITQSFYEQAEERRAALREIMAMTDPQSFLAASGYERRFIASD
jgi:hypothetical protein